MATLEIQSLNKTFSPKVVPVKDVSLTVKDGEVLTLLGPSGCGKSTVLRMIAGLEEPTHGRILLGDRDITYTRPGDRNVAMVFQSYALYPHMNVYENLSAGLKLKKVPSDEIARRIVEVSSFLGLEGLMERKPGQLSGGQRQRVAVGRALVRKSDLLLLDEPLSNLDALLREHVRAELKQIFERQNTPVVYVTHDQTEAMTLSTKVAVLNDGYVQQLDTPERIYNHPANRFVAGFVGSPQMNLLPLAGEGRFARLGEVAKIPLPDLPTPPDLVMMGIRPDHVKLADTVNESEGHTRFKAEAFLVEHLGMQSLVSVRIPNGEAKPMVLRALLPPGNWDDRTLDLAIPTALVHWFDVTSGDALVRG